MKVGFRLVKAPLQRLSSVVALLSTISVKGKTTVPIEIRQVIGVVPGSRLIWQVLASGRLSVRVKKMTAAELVRCNGTFAHTALQPNRRVAAAPVGGKS